MTGIVSSRPAEALPRRLDRSGTIRRLAGLLCSGLALLFQVEGDGSLAFAAIALVATMLGGALVSWRPDRGVGGAAFVYILGFGLFHAGLVIAVVLGGEDLLIGQGANSWVLSNGVRAAVSAVCIAVIAWEVGVVATRPGRARPESLVAEATDLATPRSRTDIVGLVGVIVGLTLIATSLQPQGGFGTLFSGYLEFLEKVADDSGFGYGVAVLGCGVGFLVASGGRARLLGWSVAVVVAAIGLPLGLRGTVLFLLGTVLVVEAKRTRINAWLFMIASVAVLTLVSVLRTTRVGGLNALLAGGFDGATPLEAIAEMGYSLYPVVVVQRWLEGGLDYRYGVTFIAPILRYVEGLAGADPGPAENDPRIFNVEIFTREGPIGGSPVAEGLRNGGILGVCVLMVAIGYVIARVDRLPATTDGGAITVVVFLPLIIAIRNSFAPVLVQVGIGITMLVVARMLGHIRSGRGYP